MNLICEENIVNSVKNHFLATAKKDSEFSIINDLTSGKVMFTGLVDGKNAIFPLEGVTEEMRGKDGPVHYININSLLSRGMEPDTIFPMTLSEAIGHVPLLYRKLGLVITFINNNGDWDAYQFSGIEINNFEVTSDWVLINAPKIYSIINIMNTFDITESLSTNKLLEILLRIPKTQRIFGVIITYLSEDNVWESMQYTNDSTLDKDFAELKNWNRFTYYSPDNSIKAYKFITTNGSSNDLLLGNGDTLLLSNLATNDYVDSKFNRNFGVFDTEIALNTLFPKEHTIKDSYAFVGKEDPREKYIVEKDGGGWIPTGEMHTVMDVDLQEYAKLSQEVGSSTTKAPCEKAVKEGIINQSNRPQNVIFTPTRIGVSDALVLPNIDTTGLFINLGDNPIINIGHRSIPLASAHVGNANAYRRIEIGSALGKSNTVKVYFNVVSKLFESFAYHETVDVPDLILFCTIIKTESMWDCNLECGFTVDNIRYTNREVGFFYSRGFQGNDIELPNINTTDKTLDLGSHPLLVIGQRVYDLLEYHANDQDAFRKISIASGTSKALKIYFNLQTRKFQAFVFGSIPTAIYWVYIGSIRISNDGAKYWLNMPFARYTVNGIESSTIGMASVALNYSSDNNGRFATRPNISGNMLDLGQYPVLSVGQKNFKLYEIWKDSPDKFRKIDLNAVSDSSRCLYFDFDKVEFVVKSANSTSASQFYVLIGTIKYLSSSNSYECNFPFEYTVDGLSKQARRVIDQDMKIVAHRGAFFKYGSIPENSLTAFRLSSMAGYDWIEADIAITKDGKFVIMHDDSINRTCKNADYTDIVGVTKVLDNTYDDLRAKYVLASDNEQMRTSIPSLEEFLLLCRHYRVKAFLDVKVTGLSTSLIIEIFNIANEILGANNFCITCSDDYLLDSVRTQNRDVRLYYQRFAISNITEIGDIIKRLQYIGNAGYYPSYDTITDTIIEQFTIAGVELGAWTILNEKYNASLARGLNFITTDVIAPNCQGDTIYNIKSKLDFSEFAHNGTLVGGVLRLQDKQSVKPSLALDRNIYAGTCCIEVKFKGTIIVSSKHLYDTVTNDTMAIHKYSVLLYNESTSLSIGSVGDSVIESINVRVIEF